MATPPVPLTRLTEIANEACASALSSSPSYDHQSVSSWNSTIIQNIISALVSETTPSTPNTPPPFKFAVNSTIIQHTPPSKAEAAESTDGPSPRRGMHSASGAFWDQTKDGMWNFKYAPGEEKGIDVVVSVMWIALA